MLERMLEYSVLLKSWVKALEQKDDIAKDAETIITNIKSVVKEQFGDKKVSQNDNNSDWYEMPVCYEAMTIKGWHARDSIFISVDLLHKKIHVVLLGFETSSNKEGKKAAEIECNDFVKKWEAGYYKNFTNNEKIKFYTWIKKGKNNYPESVIGDYFEELPLKITGPKGPNKLPGTDGYFYFGFSYDLQEYIKKTDYFVDRLEKDLRYLKEKFL